MLITGGVVAAFAASDVVGTSAAVASGATASSCFGAAGTVGAVLTALLSATVSSAWEVPTLLSASVGSAGLVGTVETTADVCAASFGSSSAAAAKLLPARLSSSEQIKAVCLIIYRRLR